MPKAPTSSSQLTPLFQLTVEVPLAQLEAVTERAFAAGLSPIVVEKPLSPLAWVEIYVEAEADAKRLGLAFERGFKGLRWNVHSVGDKDWTTFWRHHFKAHPVGTRLWVTPIWEKKKAPKGRDVRIEVNPGLSFGTGDHFTTRFCLEAIDELCSRNVPSSMLDAGCGSAILAVAAVKLGCPKALALDHDPLAVRSARENVELNGVGGQVTVRETDLTRTWPKGRHDLVCANLYGEMLMQFAHRLIDSTRRHLVLSGIRNIELDAVEQVYANLGMQVLRSDADPEWGGLILAKP